MKTSTPFIVNLATMPTNAKNATRTQKPLSVMRLAWATDLVQRVIFLAEQNLVVVACVDGNVRVYDIDTTGEPCAIFKGHTHFVEDVTQLDKDVVASVGSDRRLLTWRAATAELVGESESRYFLCSVAKLSESSVL